MPRTKSLFFPHQWPLPSQFLEKYANWQRPHRLCLTFDHDWAPDYMVRHCLSILEEYGVKATFLATGASAALLEAAAAGGHEIGLHLNLAPNSTQGADLPAMIANLRAIYPKAKGNRFHLLGHAYRDLMTLGQAGFAYDISCLRFNAPFLLPNWHPDLSMTLLAYCWEDGYAIDGVLPGSAESLDLASPGIKILNFHPLNVFLNNPNEAEKKRFQADNPRLEDVTEATARRYRNTGPGAETALRSILQAAADLKMECITAGELVQAYRDAKPA
jgi:hypothetical protein